KQTSLAVELPSVLNLADGTVSEPVAAEFALADLPEGTTTVGDKTYTYLSMNYILADADKSVTDVTVGTDFALNSELSFTAVPVQRNFRTNIYGALLTNPAIFDVEILPGFDNEFNNGAVKNAVMQKNDDGTVTCITPALPAGVTEADVEGKGGVAIKADGTPVYFEATGRSINEAMKEASEIFFAPNVNITTSSHIMAVPQSGITVYGNGATISGGERDFSINPDYEAGSTVNLTVNDLNGVKVWGQPKAGVTYNITLNNCTLKGTSIKDGASSLVMARGSDNGAIVNININDCHMEDAIDGMHSIYGGKVVVANTTFKGVVVPVNYAKKSSSQTAEITVTGCTFLSCGIEPTATDHSAYNYSAPVRVIDQGGAAKSVKLNVDNCTFTDTRSEWDILLMDYRAPRPWFAIDYTVTGCTPANPSVKAS
ncbi:MAG: hypothetical protein K2F78_04700, partial [Muribaculaceae bacterium]|nr:hypothetical protein [Muribaculaceae bacterium]